jgi:hypothetical protein
MKLLKSIKDGYLELLPPAIFFFISFTMILLTKKLILSEYGISWTGISAAFVGAFMIGKVILVVDKLSFINKFKNRKLIYSVLWKFLIYFLTALMLQYIERIVPVFMKHNNIVEANRQFMLETVWPHFWLIQMWLAVLFFIYCAMRELIRTIGREKVVKMFFGSRSDADLIAEEAPC